MTQYPKTAVLQKLYKYVIEILKMMKKVTNKENNNFLYSYLHLLLTEHNEQTLFDKNGH